MNRQTRYDDLDDETMAIYAYLDALRESGIVNMFGAAPLLQEKFDLDRRAARERLQGWMNWFSKKAEEEAA